MSKSYYDYDSSSNLLGPFPLNAETLSDPKFDNYGVYFLCDPGFWWGTKVKYVGRGHLKSRLRARIGKYEQFYYRVFPSDEGRFAKECSEFHRYGKSNHLDNEIHPAKPEGFHRKCTEIGCSGEAY